MNVSIFLTLLFLGIASPFPKVDHSLDALSNLFEATAEEVSDLVEDLLDVINDALVEDSPNVLDTHSQEQREEQQSNRTASHHSGDISRLIKPHKKVFGKLKGTSRRGLLGKNFKGVGKKTVGAFKKNVPRLKKFGKRIAEEIVADIILSEGMGAIAEAIGESILGVNNSPVIPEDSDHADELKTNEKS